MGGDLFELLVVLAIIFFGLLGGGRKKKRSRSAAGERARPRPPGAGGRAAERQGGAPTTARSGAAGSTREEMFAELERILRGQVREPEPVPPPAVPEPEEAYSLEGLEGEAVDIDAEERHQAFHDKYVVAPDAGPLPPATVQPRPAVRVAAVPLRQAVIWREILGPPKGLQ